MILLDNATNCNFIIHHIKFYFTASYLYLLVNWSYQKNTHVINYKCGGPCWWNTKNKTCISLYLQSRSVGQNTWIAFVFIWRCKSIKIVSERLVGVPEGRAFSVSVVEASSLGVNIYYREPPNYIVVCIPQMLLNLYKTFTNDAWA